MEYLDVSGMAGAAMKVLLIAGLAESLTNFRGPLIAALLARKVEVHVAAPDLEAGSATYAKLVALGCQVHSISLARAGTNPLADLRTLVSLALLMRKVRPGVVLAYTIKPVIYGMLAARITGVTKRFALITGLGYTFQTNSTGRLQQLVQYLYKLALKCADKVFFQNPDDQALFKQLGLLDSVTSVVVNGSGIDLDYYASQPMPTSVPKFLMIGRLLGDKGVREYAQAAMQLKVKNPLVVFQLAGWIDENPNAIAQTELDGWIKSGAIEYLGKLEDVRTALAGCSVFVLPSYREGTPRSVLEAMATGRAIITTDAPGCRETVEQGVNGFLVPIKNFQALSVAMQTCIDEPNYVAQMALSSLQIAIEKYDVNKVNIHMLTEMGLYDAFH
jgi:glycosyltransferase involved in cell wall biosynthesis